MRIKITAGGIFGATSELAIGTELTVKEEPKAWHGRYIVLSDDEGEPILNDDIDDIADLRAQYLEASGEEADKRWKEGTLREKIAEANASKPDAE